MIPIFKVPTDSWENRVHAQIKMKGNVKDLFYLRRSDMKEEWNGEADVLTVSVDLKWILRYEEALTKSPEVWSQMETRWKCLYRICKARSSLV